MFTNGETMHEVHFLESVPESLHRIAEALEEANRINKTTTHPPIKKTGITPERTTELLLACMEYITCAGTQETEESKKAFLSACRFTPDEVKKLGYGYILPE